MEKVPRGCAHMSPALMPLSGHGVLKSLLENPLKPPRHHEAVLQQEKQKALEDERAAPLSAFLGPTLWDRTLPYDGDGFQLEYMDLDEFLYENVPASPAHRHEQPIGGGGQNVTVDHHRHHQDLLSQNVPPPAPPASLPPPIDVMELDAMELSHASTSGRLHQSPPPPGLSSQRNTPSPIDPDSIQVPVGFELDPVDLALSTVPGQEMFDPTKRRFSTEELKPQPMIKKARKVYMPEDLKDDRYWARRRRNNMAAKRSRDARRLKENQIAVRAAFLEKENSAMRREVSELRQELGRTNNLLSRYRARHGPM